MMMRRYSAVLTACVLALAACEPAEPGSGMAAWQPGVASAYNAALLADHPADFDRPRRETPRDAVRRGAVISSYRLGATGESATASGTSTQQSGGRQ